MIELQGYHGTEVQGLTHLRPSPRGTLGSGIYFTDRAVDAANYGETVYAAKITLSWPWTISVDHESEAALEMDFDSPSIEAMLTLPGGMEMIQRARATDGLYGEALQALLLSLGYDGVVATYPDGCMEIVAFYPSQVSEISLHIEPVLDPEPDW